MYVKRYRVPVGTGFMTSVGSTAACISYTMLLQTSVGSTAACISYTMLLQTCNVLVPELAHGRVSAQGQVSCIGYFKMVKTYYIKKIPLFSLCETALGLVC